MRFGWTGKQGNILFWFVLLLAKEKAYVLPAAVWKRNWHWNQRHRKAASGTAVTCNLPLCSCPHSSPSCSGAELRGLQFMMVIILAEHSTRKGAWPESRGAQGGGTWSCRSHEGSSGRWRNKRQLIMCKAFREEARFTFLCAEPDYGNPH